MGRKIFLFFLLAGWISFYAPVQAAEIRMGDQVFQGKVTVHQDGTVTTESTAKQEEIEGEGKKQLKLKHKDGKLMVVDDKGEEVVMEEGATKFKKRSRLGAGGQTGTTTAATTMDSGTTTTTSSKATTTAPGKATTATSTTPGTQKTVKPKFDIKKVTLEGEEKGMVPPGRPLMVLVEINASEAISGPLAVTLELKKGAEKQKFVEGIEKLQPGANAFKWDLIGKPEEAQYTVSVEITHDGLKIKDKSTKMFRVGEKKTGNKE
jgi:hypothetical protein